MSAGRRPRCRSRRALQVWTNSAGPAVRRGLKRAARIRTWDNAVMSGGPNSDLAVFRDTTAQQMERVRVSCTGFFGVLWSGGEMADEPIDEPDFVSGVKVVDIGDARVSRGLTRRPRSTCPHKRMSYDPRERRVWCRDCETDVDAFDAFVNIVEYFSTAQMELNRRADEIKAAQEHTLRRRAAKEIDKIWQGNTMVPACPACGNGLLPEDFANGCAAMGREFAQAQRRRRTKR